MRLSDILWRMVENMGDPWTADDLRLPRRKATTMSRCAKRRFRTKLDAMIALARAQGRDRDELRFYRCGRCRGWHLTSQPKEARP